ncbi:hypothetical protein [Caulobacter endophyticus]|uniref:hypothetical protein n=1 Tax=Caulobacter endophyticus TaxID=2172652 RepID=UPI00240FCADA|nr:hypothetical protein [Caulobacter endophyticus]MDG2528902.1 hypothetical protein [Caulobacter endophyticus]
MSWIAGGYDSVDEITVEPPTDDDDWEWEDDPWEPEPPEFPDDDYTPPTGGYQPISNYVQNLVKGILDSMWFAPNTILARNATTQFNPDNKVASTWIQADLLGVKVTYELQYMTDGSFYIDFDKNGTPESHLKEINGSLYIDNNNDGVFETKVAG